jgi:menaquinone reductase, molybdopterin-binding-like subunit
MDRRRFLKVTAVTGASAALASCGHPENQIIRFVPDDDIVPGVAVWKPSICPLCPAACGLQVRVMDADVDVVRNGQRGVVRAAVAKKLEGLPAHPVNRGALCARGQAAIQITYHPDRVRHPLKRSGARGSGTFERITWDEAIGELVTRLDAVSKEPRRLAYLTKPRRDARADLVSHFLAGLGAMPPIEVTLLDEEVLRAANAMSFRSSQLPTIDLAHTRFVIAFGADFLGTWNSPVAQGIGYGAMRQGTRGVRGTLVQVEARMSQTGANADQWVPARPGTEGALALGLAHVIMRDELAAPGTAGEAGAHVEGWAEGLPRFAPSEVERMTGVPATRVEELARAFAQSPRPVAIIGGPALAHTNALFQALAVNALNALVGSVGVSGGIQFTPPLPWTRGSAATGPAARTGEAFSSFAALSSAILNGSSPGVELLLVDDANPVFLSPPSWRAHDALARVPFIVSFGSFIDDTSVFADLVLPDHSFLESWVDSVPETGATVATAGLAPPVMRALHETRSTPDVLLDVARRLARPLTPPLPWQTFDEMLRERFSALPAPADSADGWTTVQERGGWWDDAATKPGAVVSPPNRTSLAAQATGRPATQESRSSDAAFDGEANTFPFHLQPYASAAFHDGSTTHLPWLQEMPDPMTSAMWSTWLEINPRTAAQLGIATGDMVEITSPHGSLRAPAVVTPGIAPEVVAMPMGQGHTTFTRYASGRGVNPMEILGASTIAPAGTLAWTATRVRVSRSGNADGSLILFAGSDVEHPHEHR